MPPPLNLELRSEIYIYDRPICIMCKPTVQVTVSLTATADVKSYIEVYAALLKLPRRKYAFVFSE